MKSPGDEVGMNEEHSTKTTPGFSRHSHKRKTTELDSAEVEFIQISKSMNDIKKAFTREVDVHEKNCESRKKLFQVLCSLPGLTPEQVVKGT